MNFSFAFKLYFSSTFNYVHCSTTNFYPAFSTSFRLQCWWCHAFLQERIQKSGPWAGKTACVILGGCAQNGVFPFTQEKMEVESKNLKNNDFRRTSTWKEKLVICVFAVKHTWSDIMPVNARNCVKDTTLTTQFFLVCFIFIGLITTSIL